MAINKDLNIDPYYENFYDTENPQYKQYNRILFKPGRAVQARELTQLQTILQEQVERFGSNIYKEGTVITGINITQRNDIYFVKLNDASNFTDPTIYNPVTTVDGTTGEQEVEEFFVVGQTSGLTARILKAVNGFQTRDPNLKTFFLNYLNTQVSDTGEDIKQFIAGETLEVQNADGELLVAITVADVEEHAGQAFGASVEEGIIYQKGHFIYVEPQLTIIEKYAEIPASDRNVNVGFDVEENIITTSQDQTLLDNAQGYNNENAPGADRLQLKPILVAYDVEDEPEGFFSLIKYERSEAITIRDITQFNSIESKMATRTYEESGNYVTRGMKLSLEQEEDKTYAIVSPGKAYVFGSEVENFAKKYIEIESSEETIVKQNQATGVRYGMYFTYNHETGTPMSVFTLDGTRYDLYNNADQIIGSCSVANVTPGRIYVYAMEKLVGQENTEVAKIANLTVQSGPLGVTDGAMVFSAGNKALKSLSDVQFVRRQREAITEASSTIVLEGTPTTTPLTSNIFAINTTQEVIAVDGQPVTSGGNVTVTLEDTQGDGDPAGVPQYIYYDELISGVSPDTLTQLDVYVKTTFQAGKGLLGLPNAVKILEIIDDEGEGQDVTSKFRLVHNQKDGYYDLSYITLKTGETLTNTDLRVKFTVLRRTSTVGNGYLTANSYETVDKTLLRAYTTKSNEVIDLTSSVDFRPYANPAVSYSVGIAGAPTVPTTISKSIVQNLAVGSNSTFLSDQEVYLPRYDAVVVDAQGNFDVIKGGASEVPSKPKIQGVFQLGEIYIPGSTMNLKGLNPLRIKTRTIHNYTMKEIEGIERRLNALTENVSLSLLEYKTKDVFIPDAQGLNRFKNGIMVDPFVDFNAIDMRDPEVKLGIDQSYHVATPALKQFPIDFKRSSGSGAELGFSEYVSLGTSGSNITIIDQPYATNVRNCVSNFYRYSGKGYINPQFSADYDVVTNPDLTFDIDIATPILDLVDNLQEFIPLTRTDVVDTIVGPETTAWEGNSLIGTTVTTEFFEQSSLASSTSTSTQSVGEFVTDLRFKPYMRSRPIKVLITGLRPNTRHHFFFGGKDVNAHVTPGLAIARTSPSGATTYSVEDVVVKAGEPGAPTQMGDVVRADDKGTLAAIFTLPAETFFVGELDLEVVDVDQYSSIESGSTSYSRIKYRAYNFGIDKSGIEMSTRTVDFDVDTVDAGSDSNSARRVIRRRDPLAQTFYIKKGMANNANSMFIKDLDLYFKKKSATYGVTIELREVENGYPSYKTLPFGSKHLTQSQVVVSNDGTAATTVSFDNPVKLDVEKEYAFVVLPDGNSPDYLIWTSKVGGNDIASGLAVTQDWGDGVLFTSTNNRAWKSYQDEDAKFVLKRLDFSTSDGYVDLVPNNPEFFDVTNTVGQFRDNEDVYVEKSTSYDAGANGRVITISQSGVAFEVGDYIVMKQGVNRQLTKVEEIDSIGGTTDLTVSTPNTFDPNSTDQFTVARVVRGALQYFNLRNPDEVYLSDSSAKSTAKFLVGEQLIGADSGATATITGIKDVALSYMQPMVYVSNTLKTTTTLQLMNGNSVEKSIPFNDNVYLTGGAEARKVRSYSRIIDNAIDVQEDFKLRVLMSNNGYSSTTPTVDDDLSIINAYVYKITDDSATSSVYVSKEVVLQEGMAAQGLRVLIGAYRPAGVMIEAYARFTYKTDIENMSSWIALDAGSPELYSSATNIRDYKEFDFDLDEDTYNQEFASFQVKFVIRHMTENEVYDANVNVTPDVHTFGHVNDIRAIALT